MIAALRLQQRIATLSMVARNDLVSSNFEKMPEIDTEDCS